MMRKLIGFLCLAFAMLISALTGEYFTALLSAIGWGIYIAETTAIPAEVQTGGET